MSQTTRQVIEQFWSTANARDWARFENLLHPDMLYLVPQTRERVRGRTGFVDLFRTWPGDWHAELTLLIAEEHRAVSTIDFTVGRERETGISFFVLAEGRITHVTDYWPSPYDPPPRVTTHIERW